MLEISLVHWLGFEFGILDHRRMILKFEEPWLIRIADLPADLILACYLLDRRVNSTFNPAVEGFNRCFRQPHDGNQFQRLGDDDQ